MSACATQTFSNFTQDRFNCIVQRAAASGIMITTNQGQITKDGITVRWNFDPVGQTLEVQCMSAPFFLSCGTINSSIHDMVDNC